MKMSDNVQQLFAGLVKLRAKIKQPTKSKSNPFFKSKYVDLEGVQKAIDDAKEGTGIDYTQFIETSPDGMTGVSTMIYSDKGSKEGPARKRLSYHLLQTLPVEFNVRD